MKISYEKIKVGKKNGLLDRCKILWGIVFSHPWNDLRTLLRARGEKPVTSTDVPKPVLRRTSSLGALLSRPLEVWKVLLFHDLSRPPTYVDHFRKIEEKIALDVCEKHKIDVFEAHFCRFFWSWFFTLKSTTHLSRPLLKKNKCSHLSRPVDLSVKPL